MQTASKQQILCVFDTDDSTPIFDKDEWENSNSNIENSKELTQIDSKNVDRNLIKQIEDEINKTNDNFFKFKVVPKTTQKAPQFNIKKKPSQLQAIVSKSKNGILMEGFVQKKTDGIFFKWHTRFLALTSEKLYFFTNEKKIELTACVNLKLLPAQIKQHQAQLILDFMGECENIILKTEKPSDWKSWIKQVIQFQKKQNKVMIQTMLKPMYDSKDSMSQKQFIQTAETGDVLLFYTKNTGAQLQRFLTNSDFDHVAMVIKFKKNQLMVFQSNQMYGVSIYDWRQYIQYFDLYQKITLRKLNYIKKADSQRQIMNFVKKNLGKNYQISMNKLITLESDVNWDKINQQKTKDRGYFCSQLVAKALKSVGLLDAKKSSGRYWPVDFAEKNGLQLTKGAFLGPQQVIILNKHLKNSI